MIARRKAWIAAVVLVVLAGSQGAARAAGCGAAQTEADLREAEQSLTSSANGERSSRGLGMLSSHDDLLAVAREHAGRMASAGTIFHNDAYLASIGSLGATLLAENVGMGCSASDLHAALMASPGHRANILNGDLSHAGFAVAADAGGVLYVVQAFAAYPPVAPAEPSPAPAEPAPTVPAAEPEPVQMASVPEPTAQPAPAAEPPPAPEVAGLRQLSMRDRELLAATAPASDQAVAQAMQPASRSEPLPAVALAVMVLAAFSVFGLGRRRRSCWAWTPTEPGRRSVSA